jgi:hypothetical protein
VYILNNIIQQWALDNPDMSDDEFDALYGIDQNPNQGPLMDQYGGYVELGGYIPVGSTSVLGQTSDNYNSLI